MYDINHDINIDTICAPATTPGTGAISIIRLSGSESLSITDEILIFNSGTASNAKGYTIKFGKIYNKEGQLLDEVLVSIFKNPHSYTGEDSVEISCHASSFIVNEILNLLIEAGARLANPGEFTQRAFLNGKMDLAQAEAVADVIAAQSSASHRVALNQLKGGFSKELKEMRSQLLNIVSLMELELDFSEEEVEFADRGELRRILDAVIEHIGRLKTSFRLGNAIKNGVPVAIAGTTNAGKSTLLNALLGEERAIVSEIDGTTRDTVEETMNIDGVLFRFIDTAGIRKTEEVIEKIGIERSYQKISQAEIIISMLDLTKNDDEIKNNIDDILSSIKDDSQELIFALNKVDVAEQNGDVAEQGQVAQGRVEQVKNLVLEKVTAHKLLSIIPISAKSHKGISELKTVLANAKKTILADSSSTLVTNLRHVEALAAAEKSLIQVSEGLNTLLPTDLLSQDIRQSLYDLGSIVGEISTHEVLGNIFKNFCIGK